MEKRFYTTVCPPCPDNYNKGNIVEWRVGYELTGTPSKANNRKGSEGGDVDGWQVKSPKASLIDNDNCKGYIFGFADADYFYTMTIEEFESFVNEFSYLDVDSRTGKTKIRIKNDSKKMREWLGSKA